MINEKAKVLAEFVKVLFDRGDLPIGADVKLTENGYVTRGKNGMYTLMIGGRQVAQVNHMPAY